MGHGHHHGDLGEPGQPIAAASAPIHRALNIAVLVCAAVTLVGLLVLWPRGDRPNLLAEELGFADQVDATVVEAELGPCSYDPERELGSAACDHVTFEVTSGETAGDTAELETAIAASGVTFRTGDKVVLNYAPDGPPGGQYQFADFQRDTPLLVLGILFAVAVVALGRLRGALALAGLFASLVVLIVFMLPALLEGKSPLAVALVGSAAIALAALYLAHGVNERTAVAVLGTLVSLGLIGVLGAVFVAATDFTGLVGEDIGFLRVAGGELDFTGLLLAAIIIGSLGVLDDVTVTQVSAVWELHRTDPDLAPARLWRAALNIGRDHIASTVNTLVLAYAGASLPLLLLFTSASRPLGDVLTGETVAVELVRAFVGSIGLVASVPITTGLAVVVLRSDRIRWPWRRADTSVLS